MPFRDGVYYPFTPKETLVSAETPSLLNALPNHYPAAITTPSSGKSTINPFRFRPKLERVDWRRINAVDINHVVNNLDLDALQELIGSVTFCSLDRELCQRCRSPVDPALVKLLQLAQLTVEWLLHCQEFLTLSLRAAEEQLDKNGKDKEELLVSLGRESNLLLTQVQKQKERMKEMSAEIKQRRKIICTQQSMLSSPKLIEQCHHCDKSFLNPSYLQSHLRRRHPGEYSKHKPSNDDVHVEDDKMESLKKEIDCLKEQIAQDKEQQAVQNDLQKELERFRAEEASRTDRKLEDSKDGFRREMELLCTRNIQAMNDMNQSQFVNHEEIKVKKQERKWKSKLQDLKVHHEAQKSQLLNELSRLQLSESEQKQKVQHLKEEMTSRLLEKDKIIKCQLEQIEQLSNTKEVQVPELISVSQKPSEKKCKLVNRRKVRQELEEIISKRLEKLGVKHPDRGMKNCELRAIMAKQQSKWDSFAKEEVEMEEQERDSILPPEPQNRPKSVAQVQPTTCSVSPNASRESVSALSKAPLPLSIFQTVPQPMVLLSNPHLGRRVYTQRLPPFSSDDESEDKYLHREVTCQKPEKEKGPDLGLYEESPVKIPTFQREVQIRSPPCSPSPAAFQHHLSGLGTDEESEDDKYDDEEDTDENGEEEDMIDDELADDSSDVSKESKLGKESLQLMEDVVAKLHSSHQINGSKKDSNSPVSEEHF